MDGCPCAACAQGWTRGYWHYLARNRELTGQRLLTLHNLAFVQRVVARLRDALLAGTLGEAAASLRGADAP
jgi:queuine tRNA-ribosyltransferase